MYRLPCAIEFIRGKSTLTYIVTLSRADLPQFLSFVEKIKDGSYKGVELAGKAELLLLCLPTVAEITKKLTELLE
jgi:hypothetical protein